jgi:hypothetical protein
MLVAKVKASESDAGFDSKSELEKGKQIIDVKLSTMFLPPRSILVNHEPEQAEHLFHSQMWVKGTSFYFIR